MNPYATAPDVSAVFPSYTTTLDRQGFAVVNEVATADEAEALIAPLGVLLTQPGNTTRYRVEAEEGTAHLASSKGSQAIPIHSEASHLSIPPKYLALWCEKQVSDDGGETQVADGWGLLKQLPSPQQQLAADRVIPFGDVRAPIINALADGRRFLRMSYNLLHFGHYDPDMRTAHRNPVDPALAALAQTLQTLFERGCTTVKLRPHQLLIVDNFRLWHARTAFESQGERLLMRYWIG